MRPWLLTRICPRPGTVLVVIVTAAPLLVVLLADAAPVEVAAGVLLVVELAGAALEVGLVDPEPELLELEPPHPAITRATTPIAG